MSAQTPRNPGAEAVVARGWLSAHKWLLLRRSAQLFFLAIFLVGPLTGYWLVKGTLAQSLTLDLLPLTDPFIALQSILAGQALGASAIIGAVLVTALYGIVGGRAYCAWVCPVNPVTDLAHWLRHRFSLPKTRSIRRETRLYILGGVLLASLFGGVIAWEFINPITVLHRGIVIGGLFAGVGWMIVAAVFLFDLALADRGWCGHLCPVGAFYGLLGHRAQFRVNANKRVDCNDCMDCFAVCPEPQVIAPALRGKPDDTPVILSADCTACGRCIDVCSKQVFSSQLGRRPTAQGKPLAPSTDIDSRAA